MAIGPPTCLAPMVMAGVAVMPTSLRRHSENFRNRNQNRQSEKSCNQNLQCQTPENTLTIMPQNAAKSKAKTPWKANPPSQKSTQSTIDFSTMDHI
jgi:hypothetical protein